MPKADLAEKTGGCRQKSSLSIWTRPNLQLLARSLIYFCPSIEILLCRAISNPKGLHICLRYVMLATRRRNSGMIKTFSEAWILPGLVLLALMAYAAVATAFFYEWIQFPSSFYRISVLYTSIIFQSYTLYAPNGFKCTPASFTCECVQFIHKCNQIYV